MPIRNYAISEFPRFCIVSSMKAFPRNSKTVFIHFSVLNGRKTRCNARQCSQKLVSERTAHPGIRKMSLENWGSNEDAGTERRSGLSQKAIAQGNATVTKSPWRH
jgi:hypothetical protein